MKLLYILFSLYILCISSMPCTDNETYNNNTKLAQLSVKSCANPHEDETCSPFCICFCCGSLAVHAQAFPAINIAEIKHQANNLRCTSKIKNISFSVWQPPKLG